MSNVNKGLLEISKKVIVPEGFYFKKYDKDDEEIVCYGNDFNLYDLQANDLKFIHCETPEGYSFYTYDQVNRRIVFRGEGTNSSKYELAPKGFYFSYYDEVKGEYVFHKNLIYIPKKHRFKNKRR